MPAKRTPSVAYLSGSFARSSSNAAASLLIFATCFATSSCTSTSKSCSSVIPTGDRDQSRGSTTRRGHRLKPFAKRHCSRVQISRFINASSKSVNCVVNGVCVAPMYSRSPSYAMPAEEEGTRRPTRETGNLYVDEDDRTLRASPGATLDDDDKRSLLEWLSSRAWPHPMLKCGEDFRGAPMRRPRPISSPSLPRLPGAERCRRRCWHHSPRRGHRNSRTAPGEDEARATRSGGGDPSTDRYIISTGSRSTVRRCRAPAPSSPGGRATAPSEGKAHPIPNTPLSVVLRGGDLERADPYWPPGRVEVLRVGLQSLGDLNESRAEADERRTQGAHRDSK